MSGAMKSVKETPEYQQGFYEGFKEGQKQGLEIAKKAIETSCGPIQIQMKVWKVCIKANDGHWRTKITEALTELGYTVRVAKEEREARTLGGNYDYFIEVEADITPTKGNYTIRPVEGE